jgi:hypothetical protein
MFVLSLVVIARKRHRYAALLVAALAVALVVFDYWALQLPTASLSGGIRLVYFSAIGANCFCTMSRNRLNPASLSRAEYIT